MEIPVKPIRLINKLGPTTNIPFISPNVGKQPQQQVTHIQLSG